MGEAFALLLGGGGLGVLSQNFLRKSVIWCNLVHSEVRLLLSSRPTDFYLTYRQGRIQEFFEGGGARGARTT